MASTPLIATGYGPRNRLYFNGDPESFPIWETRFINHLYTVDKQVHDAIAGEYEGDDFNVHNRRAYAELVQVLDERSLQLIMHDTRNDGKEAFKILKDHYASTEKPRILTLYETLTTLTMNTEEDITDYMIRAERTATGLWAAGDQITDNLIIAMILKGPPESYRPFVVVHTQLDKCKTLTKFKAALNTFANTEALRTSRPISAMASKTQSMGEKPTPKCSKTIQCLSCGKMGHKSRDCRSRSKLRCDYCHKQGHIEAVCLQKKSTSACASSQFTFTTNTCTTTMNSKMDKLLVDCGATCHVINSKHSFLTFDQSFDPKGHFIELADGRRSNDLAKARGTAQYTITDIKGNEHNIILENALFVPEFPVSLFSVKSATDHGAKITFTKGGASLISGNVTVEFMRQGKLYFMPTVNASVYTTRTLEQWHKSLGHMNYQDIIELSNITEGMNITQSSLPRSCRICLENKITKSPKSQEEISIHATKPLYRIHSDICGPNDPTSREGYKYVIYFIDEYSSMIFVYLLSQKDEAHIALKKYLAEVAPIGSVKEIHTDNGGEYLSQAFQQVLLENQIKHTTTSPYSPF